ncbi:hypothetical protein O9992_29900 [Vibrio lentus]|nr:hypothetical protein [Vibrio lentus]
MKHHQGNLYAVLLVPGSTTQELGYLFCIFKVCGVDSLLSSPANKYRLVPSAFDGQQFQVQNTQGLVKQAAAVVTFTNRTGFHNLDDLTSSLNELKNDASKSS